MINKKGFTLIELIATIALILVLFVVVFPVSTNLIQKSNKKHCNTLVEEILTNAELYAIDNNIKQSEETTISLYDLYNGGYIEEEYDFKNGYILNTTNMNNADNYITVTRNIDSSNSTQGYNTYQITINGQTGKDNICK